MKNRILSLILAAVMLAALLPGGALPAQAVEKQNKTRTIGIVFDNSGSMYDNYDTAWCRATYAMEVFAAMLNEEDELQVYPMWPVVVGDSQKEYDYNHPLVIKGPQKAEEIRHIITQNPNNTPVESIMAAYQGLMRSQGDEKYLIVLTDGASFFENGSDMGGRTKGKLTELLTEYSGDMTTMYLGIGSGISTPAVSNPDRQYFETVYSSVDVLSVLTSMSNSIFGRNELALTDGRLEFDVTMNKIIVFAQGEDVSGVTVSGGTRVGEHAARYSEKGTRYGANGVDQNLQGVLVTYENLEAGSYEITCTGEPASLNVYYEPDVDLAIELVDSSGNVVDPMKGEVGSGSYELRYSLVDGNGVPTSSPLLGDVQYEITYGINGKENVANSSTGGSIPLDLSCGDVLTGDFTARFLERYSVHKGMDDLPWPSGGIPISAQPAEELRFEVSGGAGQYPLSELEEQAVYEVRAYYGNTQLTGGELKNVTLTPELTGGNARCTVKPGQDALLVRILYNDSAEQTECGQYVLSLGGSYLNPDQITVDGSKTEKEFSIEDNCSAVSVEIVLEQDYYMTSQVDQDDGFRVELLLGGAKLTPEQFSAAEVEINTDGLACDIQPDAAESCYQVKLQPDTLKSGRYKITCEARIPNEIGTLVEAKDRASLEIMPFPSWFKIVAWILLLALLALLIWLYLNSKVLPKKIVVSSCTFIVNGETIPGAAKCAYSGGKKKKGSLSVNSPNVAAVPGAACGISLNLEAVSPRRIRSGARSAKVVNVSATNPNTSSAKVGAVSFTRNPAGGGLIRNGLNPGAPLAIDIHTNCKLTVAADVMDPVDGGEIPVNLSVQLRFY